MLCIVRNGIEIKRIKRKRDLLTWRGMDVMVGLLSQGAVGHVSGVWKAYVSGNTVTPNMGDDSGDPFNNELDPLLGDIATMTWSFSPSTKVTGETQLVGSVILTGIVNITLAGNIRKIGIVGSSGVSSYYIIVEDAVISQLVIIGDNIEITYFLQLG